MINWSFDGSKYSKDDERLVPEGLYRVRITKAEESISKSNGNQMIVMTLEVNGYEDLPYPLVNYLVFNPEKQGYTNQQLGRIFDSFKIQVGDLEVEHWVGKDGGAEIIVEESEYNGRKRKQNRVKKFLIREEVDHLPAWEKPVNTGEVINSEMVNFDAEPNADSLPF